MRAVTSPEPGVVEVNWMWLPTFLGLNKELMARVDEEVGAQLVGRDLTEATLDEAHDLVIEAVVKFFPSIEGLKDFLEGLKYVRYMDDGRETQARTSEP